MKKLSKNSQKIALIKLRTFKFISSALCVLFLSSILSAQTAEQIRQSDAYFKQGVAEYDEGNYDKAIAKYSAYLKIRPSESSGWYNRGLSYFMKQDYEKAAADLSQAIKLDPKFANAYHQRGRVYLILSMLDMRKYNPAAIADLTQVIKLVPNSSEAYRDRGRAFDDSNQRERALADVNKAIQLDPKDAEAYFLRGKLNFGKNAKAADADLRMALKLDPNHPYAETWIESNNKDLAKLKQSVGLKTPQKAPNLFNEGNRYLELKQPDKAISSFEKMLNTIPTDNSKSVVSLFYVLEKADLNRHIAKAYLLKNEAEISKTKCLDAEKDMYRVLSEVVGKTFSRKLPASTFMETVKSSLDLMIIDFDILEPHSVRAIEIAQACIDIHSKLSTKDDPNGKLLMIGMMRASLAEFTAKFLNNASEINLTVAEMCQGKAAKLCGAASSKNEVSKYSDKSLETINKAIAIWPNMKKSYAQRAKVYRFLGKHQLAAADELRSK